MMNKMFNVTGKEMLIALGFVLVALFLPIQEITIDVLFIFAIIVSNLYAFTNGDTGSKIFVPMMTVLFAMQYMAV